MAEEQKSSISDPSIAANIPSEPIPEISSEFFQVTFEFQAETQDFHVLLKLLFPEVIGGRHSVRFKIKPQICNQLIEEMRMILDGISRQISAYLNQPMPRDQDCIYTAKRGWESELLKCDSLKQQIIFQRGPNSDKPWEVQNLLGALDIISDHTAETIRSEDSIIELESSLLFQPLEQGLADPEVASRLFSQLLYLLQMFERGGVKPEITKLSILYYMPLSLQLIVVPREDGEFLDKICDAHWNLFIEETREKWPFFEDQCLSPIINNDYKETVISSHKEIHDNCTLWTLDKSFISYTCSLLLILYKSYPIEGVPQLQANPPRREVRLEEVKDSQSDFHPSKLTKSMTDSRYIPSYGSCGQASGGCRQSEADSSHNELMSQIPSERENPSTDSFKGFLSRNVTLACAVNSTHEEIYILVEETRCKELDVTGTIKNLLKLKGIIKDLHERGAFHGLLCPSTIRQDEREACVLSLPALNWPYLPLLYPAIPEVDKEFIAPEVKLFATTWRKPIDPVDWKKADVYGFSALIQELARAKNCELSPELQRLTTAGRGENSQRPSFEEVIEALENS